MVIIKKLNIVQYFYILFVMWVQHISNILSFLKKKKQTCESAIDKTKLLLENKKQWFLKQIENMPTAEQNKNVDKHFYDKKQYQSVMSYTDNELEKIWKTRIMYKSSPFGNIIMYFDPYKIGFTYYCDVSVPYDVLNTFAMQYVNMFRCYDFFLDEIVTEKESPLLKLFEDDKNNNNDKNKKDGDKPKILKNGPFAKFKNTKRRDVDEIKDNENKSGKKDNENKNKDSSIKIEKLGEKKDKSRNRFIYLGKSTNFVVLKTSMKKTQNNSFLFDDVSHLLKDLQSNSYVQDEIFNYRKFKEMQIERCRNNNVT